MPPDQQHGLFPETTDELIHRLAEEMSRELMLMAQDAYTAINEKAEEAQKFARRSFGQRRRFLRERGG